LLNSLFIELQAIYSAYFHFLGVIYLIKGAFSYLEISLNHPFNVGSSLAFIIQPSISASDITQAFFSFSIFFIIISFYFIITSFSFIQPILIWLFKLIQVFFACSLQPSFSFFRHLA
jgi:hypothetical protein